MDKGKNNYYCNVCGNSARSGTIFCNGLCKKWVHLKCFGIIYSDVRYLSKDELSVWKCPNCSDSLGGHEEGESNLNLSNNNSFHIWNLRI